MLMAEAKNTFETLKRASHKALVLVFADFDKPFLLETNASKLGLGVVLSQKQADSQFHPVAYASQYLTIHEHNYHSMKQEFLVVKRAIAEQFQENLLWKPFIVRTDNNLLTYIMTTPTLDAIRHWWVGSLAWFMDMTMQLQMPWAESPWSWMQNCEVHPRWGHHRNY